LSTGPYNEFIGYFTSKAGKGLLIKRSVSPILSALTIILLLASFDSQAMAKTANGPATTASSTTTQGIEPSTESDLDSPYYLSGQVGMGEPNSFIADAVAVSRNPASGDLYVAEINKIKVFDTAGDRKETLDLPSSAEYPNSDSQNTQGGTFISVGFGSDGSIYSGVIGNWDKAATITSQWYREEQKIPGATGRSYILSSDDLDHEISVRVSGNATGYRKKVMASQWVMIGLGRMLTKNPSIRGIPKAKRVLGVEAQAWAINAVIKYQWLLDGKPIRAATKPFFTLVPSHKGHKISVQVTETATGYNTATATSTPTKIG